MMLGITSDQVGGIIRAVLTTGLGYVVGKGYITSDAASDLVVTGTAVGVSIWSAWTNRPTKVTATPSTGPAIPTTK